ncbi:hypothetical protein BDV97DRAFT_31541 [Delphinella strobiligena]|nr:hypothetical protein BDV97DRAFT_31541 [Delphinella strobiligena]
MDKEFKREILLSYRAIFGQHRWSRTLFLDDFEGSNILTKDPLLKTLCAKPLKATNHRLPGNIWPESCRYRASVNDAHSDILTGDSLLNILWAAPLKALIDASTDTYGRNLAEITLVLTRVRFKNSTFTAST